MKTKICICGESRPEKFYDKCNLCKKCLCAARKKEYRNRPKLKPMSDEEIEQASHIDRSYLKGALVAAYSNCHDDGIGC